jgi:Glyoxalase/Bleomycin resistance protein/Dioxygenase superfamily
MQQAVVRRVDHLNIPVPDPQELFSFLTERLQLPVAWNFVRMPGFESGGAAVGITLEPMRYAPNRRSAPEKGALFAIAFEPEPIEDAARELHRRGISHSPPIPVVGTYPAEANTGIFRLLDRRARPQTLWTVVVLGGFMGNVRPGPLFSDSSGVSRLRRSVGRLAGRLLGSARFADRVMAASVSRTPFLFICQYHGFNVEESRRRARDELERRGGGPLGVVSVAEIVISARDAGAETQRWQALLDPFEPVEPGLWQLGDGPAIRVMEGAEDRIKALVWHVRSLEQAVEWLDRERMLATIGEHPAIAPEAVQGIEIQLAEGPPSP